MPSDRAINRYLVDQSINFCLLTGSYKEILSFLADQWRPRIRVQMRGIGGGGGAGCGVSAND